MLGWVVPAMLLSCSRHPHWQLLVLTVHVLLGCSRTALPCTTAPLLPLCAR